MPETMNAIIISSFGGPEVLQHQTVSKPLPARDEVLIRVHAFGVNHAEMHMRKGEWDEYHPISGLECVGIVEFCPSGDLAVGTKIVAVMGGMGRTRPGGYGEFVSVPLTNVLPVETKLSWAELAALPEVYCTAWTCLFTVLDLKRGERLLIRGATSTVGQAALNLAVDAGAVVTATTRREERFEWLKSMDAVDVVREQDGLDEYFDSITPALPQEFDKVLNLIGNRVLLESLKLTKPGGRMLQAGWLGGLAPVKLFNPMVEMKPGVHFSLFHSKVLGSRDFPLSGIPMQEIIQKIEAGKWDAKPARVFEYSDIQNAHRALDSHDTKGKIVVIH
ncbi:chaperonin 10-like protein [Lentinula lateritia]|uniref:Chaperonin 10-like protein n=1 Tax=Lentinula lateritia TaxID=40482 RepID=A0ABQ8VKY3_9AGAR|nr:chaperonin 10-like protein [Lentinula lateritia]